jgi:hypothetical protein
VHIEGLELSAARGHDAKVASMLKKTNPALYMRLAREAARRNGNGHSKTRTNGKK